MGTTTQESEAKRRGQPGDMFGPYEVIERIGAGGMGVVYRARDSRMGREVAVKVLEADVTGEPSRVRRFEQEAKAAGALNHPNLLAVYDVGHEGRQPYMVTELLEGKTLQNLLAADGISVTKALDYAVQIARGVAAAHDAGIVHRDLKPGNIFVTDRGHVKILDFGIAKLTPPTKQQDETLPANTGEGSIIGTTGYMSPEQVQGRAADRRSDIFSFGVVLHEMLTGRRAFEGVSAVETAYATLRDEPPPISELTPRAPLALTRIVRRCLEKAPGQRFQTAHDLAFHLETITDLSTGGHSEVAAPRRGWLGLALVVVLLAAAVSVVVRAPEDSVPSTAVATPNSPDDGQPLYDLITFRRGTIMAARFAPDGLSVIYAAAWGGEEMQVYRTEPQTPGSQSIGHVGSSLFDVSSSGELALATGSDEQWGFAHARTLALAPATGGPREVRKGVTDADWAPNGTDLAVVVGTLKDGCKLEYPLGKVIAESPGWISHPKVSPDGGTVAFLEHEVPVDDRGTVAVVDRNGVKKTLTDVMGSAQGVAWSPDGSEVWFTAAESGTTRAVWAVSLSGALRVVVRTPGTLTLQDISTDGRLLLTRDDSRTFLYGKLAGKSEVDDLSWFDWSLLVDLARDGKTVFFLEAGEAVGSTYALYSRAGKDVAAVRLATEVHLPVQASPDGKWLLGARDLDAGIMKLIPTGAGTERELRIPGARRLYAWSWLPSSDAVLVQGVGKDVADSDGQHSALWRLNVVDGTSELMTLPPLLRMAGQRAVGPSGQILAVQEETREVFLLDPDGKQIRSLGTFGEELMLVGWSDDGKFVYLRDRSAPGLKLARVNIRSGKVEDHDKLAPADRAGFKALHNVSVAGDAYAYSFIRTLSQLYVVSGLE